VKGQNICSPLNSCILCKNVVPHLKLIVYDQLTAHKPNCPLSTPTYGGLMMSLWRVIVEDLIIVEGLMMFFIDVIVEGLMMSLHIV